MSVTLDMTILSQLMPLITTILTVMIVVMIIKELKGVFA